MPDLPLPAAEIVRLLQSDQLPRDREFDRFLPRELRTVSAQYWTPIAAAVQAGRWLCELGARSVLDIGSGAGKFCVVAHLATGLRCVGLEHRQRLVTAAATLARTFDVEQSVSFVQGALGETELPEVDAYYMYNPFGENLYGISEQLDDAVELGVRRYRRDLELATSLLSGARVGTHLLTYNGFGGDVPSGYCSLRVDRTLRSVLQVWRKIDEKDARLLAYGAP